MNLLVYVDKIDDNFFYAAKYDDVLFGERLLSNTKIEAILEALKTASAFIPEQVEMIFVNDIVTANYLSTKKSSDKYTQALIDTIHDIYPIASFHFLPKDKTLEDEIILISRRKVNVKHKKAVAVGGYHCLRCLYNKIDASGKPRCTKHKPDVAKYEDGWRCSSWVKKWWLDGNELFIGDLDFENQDY